MTSGQAGLFLTRICQPRRSGAVYRRRRSDSLFPGGERRTMAELAGVMVGNYFLLECLEHEGMVETYSARPTTRGGCDVVLRIFRPAFPDITGFQEHFMEEVEK